MNAGFRERQAYWLLIAPAFALMLFFYLLPLVQLLWISVTEPAPGLGNYKSVIASAPIRRIVWTTLRVCIETTGPTVILGYLIAYAMVHVNRGQFAWMMLCVMLSFWVSVLVRAFSWLVMLNTNGVVNTFLISTGLAAEPLSLAYNETGVVISIVHFMLPFAVLPIYANMAGIDKIYVAAARGLGASPWQAFWRVYFPLSAPGIVGASVLVFVFSLGFFVTPAIMGGGKVVMLAEYISVQIQDLLRWGLAATLAALLLIGVFAILAIMSRFIDLRMLFGAK
ncbi:MAG: ABC transporter permease [Rhodospirillaceae bacterium]|nr:ABC transporter permease [Rhodospirillaceae bacterium]MCY4066895.1 ABC transporter permease [Rhodospirillaceae bacterium]MDE0704327.1 ABC transporter permease [Rhodospirillaceae bacterium]MXW92025.1 ABC transporter permease [Rhodospirillaceae bacterium]MYB12853.1 ABC transporter permease [Rhodospirillaceae bacterium]